MKKENEFQPIVIKELYKRFPITIVLKNDEQYCQGFPDLSVVIGSKVFFLECKKSANEPFRPNQKYYIDFVNSAGGFARMICPENKEEVFHELEQSLFS